MNYDKENIFAKILKGDIPCDKVFENDYVLSFKDINPKAKTHILIIPKKPFLDISDFLQNADTTHQTNFWKSIDEIIRLYDGVDNPIGKAYTKEEFCRMLSPYFLIMI